MKCIINALAQKEYKPKRRWWGFVEGECQFLCRYNHVFVIWRGKDVIFANYETFTDRIDVAFAIRHRATASIEYFSEVHDLRQYIKRYSTALREFLESQDAKGLTERDVMRIQTEIYRVDQIDI